MQKIEEDLLVMAAQQGNHNAYRLLFLQHQKTLLRFAFTLCQDQELAKEATQESWIKSAKSLRKLTDPRAFKSWLYRLTRWKTLDLVRQRQRRDAPVDNEVDPQELEQQTGQTNKDDKQLTQAIRRLPPLERNMIHLFYLDDMTLNEISIVLDIPVGTVKSRLNRARSLLKQKFGSEHHEY